MRNAESRNGNSGRGSAGEAGKRGRGDGLNAEHPEGTRTRTSRVLGPHGSQAEISQAAFHRYLTPIRNY